MKSTKTLFLILICIFLFSCSENDEILEETKITHQDSATNSQEEIATFNSPNISKPSPSTYLIEVDFTDQKNQLNIPITFEFTSDSGNLTKDDLEERFHLFNGTFTVTVDGQVLREMTLKNGAINTSKKYDFIIPPSRYNGGCGLFDIIECAIDNMNDWSWIQRAICFYLGNTICLALELDYCRANCFELPPDPYWH